MQINAIINATNIRGKKIQRTRSEPMKLLA